MTADQEQVVAFIDIGTNSIRLLVVRLGAGGGYTVLSEQKEVVRLGEGEFPSDMLSEAAMDRAVLVCRTFVDLARSFHATEFEAVATSATREARNQQVFLNRLATEANLPVRVIAGREEARLIYLGIRSGVDLGDQTALFIDIGGGSTELSVGTRSPCTPSISARSVSPPSSPPRTNGERSLPRSTGRSGSTSSRRGAG